MQRNRQQCDVLIVGGGVAGMAAAVGAMRSGAEVVLLEKYGFMGGMATAGMVSSVCGLYPRNMGGNARPVAGGFVAEFAGSLAARQRAEPLALPGGLMILPYEPWHLVRLADGFISDTSIHLLLHSHLVSVKKAGRSVTEVDCLSWNSAVTISPLSVVDCTGEATLVDCAGGSTVKGAGQSGAVLFRVDGLPAATQGERLALLRTIVHAAEEGRIHADCRNISFVPGHAGGGKSLLNVPIPADGASAVSVTGMELHGRRIVEELMEFLVAKSYLARASCPQTAVQVGIRVGRMARGREVLTLGQVLRCVKNETGVARGCWPVEVWSGGRRPEVTHLPEDDYYDIPSGCLIADGLDNVFMAGRCMSAEEEAMGSARVIGTALGTGYAAGTLAAFQAKGKSGEEAVALLREQQQCR
jgi:hypothetical protein